MANEFKVKNGIKFPDNTIQTTAATGGSSATITDDTATNTTQYVVMARSTSGNFSTAYVDSTALAYNPSSGVITFDTGTILQMNAYRETASSPSITSNVLTLDLAAANCFTVSLNANVTTLTINNIAASNKVSSLTLVLTANGTAYSITWPGSFKWPGGTAPTLTSTNNKRDIITAFTTDAGTTWLAFISGQNL